MSINVSAFPSILKLTDVTLTYKKGLQQQKTNYQCPSQSTENLWIYTSQTIRTNFFSKYQNGFRNGFHPENGLVVIREKFGNSLDAVLLTDLLKVFDCLLHELMNAKLHACGVNMLPLRLM